MSLVEVEPATTIEIIVTIPTPPASALLLTTAIETLALGAHVKYLPLTTHAKNKPLGDEGFVSILVTFNRQLGITTRHLLRRVQKVLPLRGTPL